MADAHILRALKAARLAHRVVFVEAAGLAVTSPIGVRVFRALLNHAITDCDLQLKRIADALKVGPSAVSRWHRRIATPDEDGRRKVVFALRRLVRQDIRKLK